MGLGPNGVAAAEDQQTEGDRDDDDEQGLHEARLRAYFWLFVVVRNLRWLFIVDEVALS